MYKNNKWAQGSMSGSGHLLEDRRGNVADAKDMRVPPRPIKSRELETEKQYVPRAIYNDPIQELLLKEEGQRGRARTRRRVASEEIIRPLKRSNSYLPRIADSPVFARCPSVVTDRSALESAHEDSLDMSSIEEESRTVILTEIGVDIMNNSYKPPIAPLPKAALRNPSDWPVYHVSRHKSLPPVFGSTVRAATWRNTLSLYDEAQTKAAYDNTQKMLDAKVDYAKSLTLRYSRKANRMRRRRCGLSFRGRGKLEANHLKEFEAQRAKGKVAAPVLPQKIYPKGRGRENISALAAGSGGTVGSAVATSAVATMIPQNQKQPSLELQGSACSSLGLLGADSREKYAENLKSTTPSGCHVSRTEIEEGGGSSASTSRQDLESTPSEESAALHIPLRPSDASVRLSPGSLDECNGEEQGTYSSSTGAIEPPKEENRSEKKSLDSLSSPVEDAWLEEERKALYASWGRQVPDEPAATVVEEKQKQEDLTGDYLVGENIYDSTNSVGKVGSDNSPAGLMKAEDSRSDANSRVLMDEKEFCNEKALKLEQVIASADIKPPSEAAQKLSVLFLREEKISLDLSAKKMPSTAAKNLVIIESTEAGIGNEGYLESYESLEPAAKSIESSVSLNIENAECTSSQTSPSTESLTEKDVKLKSAKSKAIQGLKKLTSPISKIFNQSKDSLLSRSSANSIADLNSGEQHDDNSCEGNDVSAPKERRESTSSRISRSSRMSKMSRSSINHDGEVSPNQASSADTKKSFGSLRSFKEASKSIMGRSNSNSNVKPMDRRGSETSVGVGSTGDSPQKSNYSLKSLKAKSIGSFRSLKLGKNKSGSKEKLGVSEDNDDDAVVIEEDEDSEVPVLYTSAAISHITKVTPALSQSTESTRSGLLAPKESDNLDALANYDKSPEDLESSRASISQLKQSLKKATNDSAMKLEGAEDVETIQGMISKGDNMEHSTSSLLKPAIMEEIFSNGEDKDKVDKSTLPATVIGVSLFKESLDVFNGPARNDEIKELNTSSIKSLMQSVQKADDFVGKTKADTDLVETLPNEPLSKDFTPDGSNTNLKEDKPTAILHSVEPSTNVLPDCMSQMHITTDNETNVKADITSTVSKPVQSDLKFDSPAANPQDESKLPVKSSEGRMELEAIKSSEEISTANLSVSVKALRSVMAVESFAKLTAIKKESQVENFKASESSKTPSNLSNLQDKELREDDTVISYATTLEKSNPIRSLQPTNLEEKETTVKTNDVNVFAASRPMPRVAMFMNAMDLNSIQSPQSKDADSTMPISVTAKEESQSSEKPLEKTESLGSQAKSQNLYATPAEKEKARQRENALKSNQELDENQTIPPERKTEIIASPPTSVAGASTSDLVIKKVEVMVPETKATTTTAPDALREALTIPQSMSLKASLKGVKCDVKFENFELHCLEKGKPAKHFFPIESRRILKAQQDSENEVTVHACVTRKKNMGGSKLKKLKFQFEESSKVKPFVSMIMIAVYGSATLDANVTRNVLVLIDKFDSKEATKNVDKYMKPVVANALQAQDWGKAGNIVVISNDFAPRLCQVLVRNSICSNPVNLPVESDPVDAALAVVKCEFP
ncbi:hypothetical protein HDU67_010234 [Dinochytrium kinnereticum]|nr:hypothetical protein HDU67_010234 [Dinochytrium kinnereticum]